MAFPASRSKQKGAPLLTDKYEIRLHHDAGIVRFYRRRVKMGEIVSDDVACFTLKLIDFQEYPGSLDTLIDTLAYWNAHWKKNR